MIVVRFWSKLLTDEEEKKFASLFTVKKIKRVREIFPWNISPLFPQSEMCISIWSWFDCFIKARIGWDILLWQEWENTFNLEWVKKFNSSWNQIRRFIQAGMDCHSLARLKKNSVFYLYFLYLGYDMFSQHLES